MESKGNNPRLIFRLIRIVFNKVIDLVTDTLSIKHGADIQNTTENIKNDVEFKGHQVWILIFSIFIASIGLNTNSIPIIIGAMLISPLMGPILGLGLSLGTIDIELLKKSAKNLAVMVTVSMISSFIYFKLTPFQDECPEILSRTKPGVFDVLIASFGGLAGIIAGSRKERTNVIPGVAIATALMPPLCTAGYGLATGKYDYFLGAFYLFLLNAAGITIMTLIVVRYMNFPRVTFIDKKREKRVTTMIWVFWFVLIIPSGISFYSVINEDLFTKRVKSFVDNEFTFDETYLIRKEIDYAPRSEDSSAVHLYFYGDMLDSTEMAELDRIALEKYGINNTDIIYHQGKDNRQELSSRFNDVENSYSALIDQTNQSIAIQNERIDNLKHKLEFYTDSTSVQEINKEAKIIFPEILSIAFGKMSFPTDSNKLDVISTYKVDVRKPKRREPKFDEAKLTDWLKYKTQRTDTLSVIYNYISIEESK